MLAKLVPFLLLSRLALALPTTPASSPAVRRNIFDTIFGDDDAAVAPTSMDPAQTTTLFNRDALFAQAAYCSATAITPWACGPPCDALGKDIQVLVAGGDDGLTPGFFVAHDPSTQSLIVAHQGTDSSNILSILNDAQFALSPIDASRFPGAPEGTEAHAGFQDTHLRTSDIVLSTVKAGLASTGVKTVKVIGHSLGAAIGTLDALMLRLVLPADISVSATVFGLPRSGNEEFANFVDATLGKDFVFVTNQHDPVPQVPPTFLGYAHPSNEVHIVSIDNATAAPTAVLSCPGQDNDGCSAGNDILHASVSDHKGPYFQPTIIMSGKGCPL